MERYLRRVRSIPGNVQSSSHATKLDISSIVFAVLGGLCLMLLSIFDAFNHSTAHFTLTAVFVICIAISTVLQTQEVRILERTHLDRAHLRRNAIMKLIIVSLAIAGAIVFAVMQT